MAVAKASGFNIFMPVADTDVDVIYDAVGALTVQAITPGACAGAIKFFRLRFDIYDPCFPPSVLNLAQGTVVERMTIEKAFLVEDSFAEDEEANIVGFSGQALDDKIAFVAVP